MAKITDEQPGPQDTPSSTASTDTRKPTDLATKGKKKKEVDPSIFKSRANYSSAILRDMTEKKKKASDNHTSDLDFSDVRNGDVSIVDNGSQMDGESLRVNQQGLLGEAIVKQQRSMANLKSVEHFAPADRIHFQILILEQQDQAQEIHRMVENLDGQVNNERSRLNQVLRYLLHSIPGMEINRMVYKFQKPTLSLCRDLELQYDYQLMITGVYNPPHIVKDKKDKDELKLLQQRILLLESQLQRAQVSTHGHGGTNDQKLRQTTLLKPESRESKAINQQRI
ncbi:uncharacterized protein EV154DRAFT_486972 [Mucor mucedo]|uniref:uncharacterized protein n=1 Tax=Mucor mucedo TaxID=29922 RepID=UPI00221F26EC|nr:uncharacterized protein EV154DRAFT_486972 [Mucor mucedo]KAI7874187.1 hypothetical protein EV154DRAFT_486972 [Mucor mucedo]